MTDHRAFVVQTGRPAGSLDSHSPAANCPWAQDSPLPGVVHIRKLRAVPGWAGFSGPLARRAGEEGSSWPHLPPKPVEQGCQGKATSMGTGISLSPSLPSFSGWGSSRASGAKGSSRNEGEDLTQERSILALRLSGPILQGGVFAVYHHSARLQVWLFSRGRLPEFPGLPGFPHHRGSLAGVASHLSWTQWAKGPGMFPEEQGLCGWSSGTRVK